MYSESLMIGDWVMLNPDLKEFYEFAGKPCQVIGLRDDDGAIKIDYDNGKYFWTDGEDDVIPIPLTAEILEKNGHKIIGYAVWDLDCGAEVQWVPETLDTINPRMQYRLATRQKNFGVQDTLICHIKYVHQLQHALRLYGVNKEIEL